MRNSKFCNMHKKLNRSNLIKERFIECSHNNELLLSDECKILQHLFKKLHFLTISDAAKEKGISYNTVKLKIKKGEIMNIQIGGQIFVSI